MDLSNLTDQQLKAALVKAIQKYIFINLHALPHEIPQNRIFKDQLIGEIVKEARKRKNANWKV